MASSESFDLKTSVEAGASQKRQTSLTLMRRSSFHLDNEVYPISGDSLDNDLNVVAFVLIEDA